MVFEGAFKHRVKVRINWELGVRNCELPLLPSELALWR